jgi:hypothetical protein
MASQRKAQAAPQKKAEPEWHVVVAKHSATVDMDGQNVHVHGGARYASTHEVVRAHPDLFDEEVTQGLNVNE